MSSLLGESPVKKEKKDKEKKEKKDKDKKDKSDKKEKKDKSSLASGDGIAPSSSKAPKGSHDSYPKTIAVGSTTYRLLKHRPLDASGQPAAEPTMMYLPEQLVERFSITSGSQLPTIRACHPFGWRAKWEPSKERYFFVNLADKTIKTWKLSEVDPSTFPSAPAPDANPSPLPPPSSQLQASTMDDGASSVKSRATNVTAVSSPPPLVNVSRLLRDLESEEALARNSRLLTPEGQEWAALLSYETKSQREAARQEQLRVAADRDAIFAKHRRHIEEEEHEQRVELIVVVEAESRASLSAKFKHDTESLVGFLERSWETKKVSDRVQLVDDEHNERREIEDHERAEYAIASVDLYESVRATSEYERRVRLQNQFREDMEDILQNEESSREAIIRSEGNTRMKLAADEGRSSVAISMERTKQERHHDTDRRARELLMSTWVDECFFTMMRTLCEFCLQTTQMYHSFIRCVEAGRPPAIRFEDLNFIPPSFLEEKWRSLERTQERARSPIGEVYERSRSATHDSSTADSSAKKKPQNGAATKEFRIEMWKAGLSEFIERQRHSGSPLGIIQGSIYDAQGKHRTEAALTRYSKRCSAALEHPLFTPEVPFDMANKNRQEMYEALQKEAEALKQAKEDGRDGRRHFRPYSDKELAKEQQTFIPSTDYPLDPLPPLNPTTQHHAYLSGEQYAPGVYRTEVLPLQSRHEDHPRQHLERSRSGSGGGTRYGTAPSHSHPPLHEEDLIWDDFQSRGVLITENGLTARHFTRPTVTGGTSSQPKAPISRDSFAAASLGIGRGQFVWEVKITKEGWTAFRANASSPSGHPAFSWGGMQPPPALKPPKNQIMVGMATRLFTGKFSKAPAYFYLEDGSISCSPDGGASTAFGDPLFPQIEGSGEEAAGAATSAVVTVFLNMNEWEMSFSVNGAPQGVAFRFTPLHDPEPLFPVVVLASEGQTATLQAPALPHQR